MRRTLTILAAALVAVLLSSYLLSAQDTNKARQMTFFITSVGIGDGGNLGGLAGADAQCQKLAMTAGADPGRTFHAYLSTQGANAVNARDRIGKGPWTNADGAVVAPNLPELHGETGQSTPMNRTVALTEKGRNSSHDVLTGSTPDGKAFTDGKDHTCNNWTSNAKGMGSAQIGHYDRTAGGRGGGGGFGGGGGDADDPDRGEPSWTSSHPTKGCSQEDFAASGGRGLLYCFAIN